MKFRNCVTIIKSFVMVVFGDGSASGDSRVVK